MTSSKIPKKPCFLLKIFAFGEGGGGDTPTTQLVLSTSALGACVRLFGGLAQCWLDDLCYLPKLQHPALSVVQMINFPLKIP